MGIGYIYLITNKINGKKYVGKTTTSIEERWREHCKPCNGIRSGIDSAIQKYGVENFSCEKICECQLEDLSELEKYYIEKYNSYQGDNSDLGYNLTRGGDGSLIYNINEEEMLQKYMNGATAVELAKYYGCSDKAIGDRLKKYNVDTKLHQKNWLKNHPETWKENFKKGRQIKHFGRGVKAVRIIDLNLEFPSLKECSQWLIDNGYSKSKSMEMVRKGLSAHLNGKTKTYLNMRFEFI